jgi:hypothetical protein
MTLTSQFALPAGNHELGNRVDDFEVGLYQAGPLVQLTALIRYDLPEPRLPSTPQVATTLAIRMGPKVAMILAHRILAEGQKMGWPQPTPSEIQAATR